jgi:2-hydroxychromene-2-carboxylate isomerase
MQRIEFFFDLSSPYTWCAFLRIESLCAEVGAELVWKPVLIGGVFNAVNPDVARKRANPVPVKEAYADKDRQDLARYFGATGLRLGRPPGHPVPVLRLMRGAFVALDAGVISPYSARVFEAYWRDSRNINDDSVIGEIAESVGLERAGFSARINEPDCKERLRANTDELIRRGGFGSPTMFLNDTDMYFGSDRLILLEWAARGRKPGAGLIAPIGAGGPR